MNKANLKKLAQLAVADKKIGPEVEGYVVQKLTRADLKSFLFYLRQETEALKVYVRTAEPIDKTSRYTLETSFKEKNLDFNYETLPSLGGGIQIEHKDSLIELSLRSLIKQCITKIRESL